MRKVYAVLAAVCLAVLALPARAQTSLVTPDGQHYANALAIWCAQTNGTAIACNFSGGSGGSNAAAGATGSAPPGSASYTGFLSGGSLVGVSAGNPLPITGSISASNPSVSTTGSAAPASATELGFISSGNLVGVSAASALPVSVANFPSSQAVTGTFWQATQPVSAASLPLPTGAATSAGQGTINGDAGVQTHIMNFPSSQAVTGAFFQTTQPVSAAALPLPTGAATAANQVTPTAAGTSGANASSIQGIAGGVAVPMSATALPLPAGAATSALQSTINTTLGTPFQAGGSIGNTGFADTTLAPAVSGGKVQTNNAAPTGTVSDFGGTAVTTSATLVAAASGYRLRAIVFNNSANGGGTLSCRADGGTATSGTGVQIPPGGGAYEWDYPQAGTAAINCACSAGTCTAGGEYVQ